MQTFEIACQKKKIDRFEMMELAQIWVNFYQKGLCLPSVRQMSFNGQKKHFIPQSIPLPFHGGGNG